MYCNHPPKCVLRLLKKSSKRLGVQCMVLCIKFMTFDITGVVNMTPTQKNALF